MMDIPCQWALTGVSLLQFVLFLEVTINRILWNSFVKSIIAERTIILKSRIPCTHCLLKFISNLIKFCNFIKIWCPNYPCVCLLIITSYINQFTWTNLLNLVCQCCRRWGTVHDLWRSHTEVPGLSWRELWWIHIEAVRFQCRHFQRWVRRVDHFIVNIVMPRERERTHTHNIYWLGRC